MTPAHEPVLGLLPNLPLFIIIIDENDRIVYINRVVPPYLPEQVVGASMYEFVPPDSHEVIRAALRRSRETGAPVPYEMFGYGEGVSRRWYYNQVIPTKTAGQMAIVALDIDERKRAENALRDSEQRFEGIFESAPLAIALVARDHRLRAVNRAFAELLGYSEAELKDKTFEELTHPEDVKLDVSLADRLFSGELSHYKIEKRYFRKDGEVIWAELTASLVSSPEGPLGIGMVKDLTEAKRLQAQLLQAQKMEVVGRLAGGVAHDFNNLLTAILGYTEINLRSPALGEALRSDFEEIRTAAQRAAKLTHQLLAFSRRQIIEPRVVDLNSLVLHMDKMVRRLLGEDIELAVVPGTGSRMVRADPGQLEQVVVNLAVNARDAMPKGGKLVIEVSEREFTSDFQKSHPGAPSGRQVVVTVTDNGTGLAPEAMAHLFEPFFTTKEQGKGTGLGLATCYGIIKQSGGFIWVESEPGKGAAFSFALPRVEALAAPVLDGAPEGDGLRGQETILLVEDEPSVRSLATRVLRGRGYEVLAASNGDEALGLMKTPGFKADLLLTDVVMPQMGGRQLADRLKTSQPKMKVLFMSGYTDEAIVHHGVLEPGTEFLQKPFSPESLAAKVRQVLDGKK